jgi:hypothetical protein
MFKNPSKHASTPLYSIPEFNLTRTGRPSTDFRKSDGLRFFGAESYKQQEHEEGENIHLLPPPGI